MAVFLSDKLMNKAIISGVILAGGLARRMNHQDKGLMLYHQQPLVSYAITALAPVVTQLWLNANRNQAAYATLGHPVIADASKNFDGPLAGILAALTVTRAGILVVMPCDCPLIQSPHLQKLVDALLISDSDIAVAVDNERLHPVVLALKTNLKTSVANYLNQGGRKMLDWLTQHKVTKVDFSSESNIFLNINTLDELAALELQTKQPA